MPKNTSTKPAAETPDALVAAVGGNLADGTRFEEGDDLAKLDLDAKTIKALRTNGIFADPAVAGDDTEADE